MTNPDKQIQNAAKVVRGMVMVFMAGPILYLLLTRVAWYSWQLWKMIFEREILPLVGW